MNCRENAGKKERKKERKKEQILHRETKYK